MKYFHGTTEANFKLLQKTKELKPSTVDNWKEGGFGMVTNNFTGAIALFKDEDDDESPNGGLTKAGSRSKCQYVIEVDLPSPNENLQATIKSEASNTPAKFVNSLTYQQYIGQIGEADKDLLLSSWKKLEDDNKDAIKNTNSKGPFKVKEAVLGCSYLYFESINLSNAQFYEKRDEKFVPIPQDN